VEQAAHRIMTRFLRQALGEQVGQAAVRALLSEAAVTPKPGLVDRSNNGAHRDLDFFLFIDSAAAIAPFFAHCAQAGFDSAGEGSPLSPEALFASLRGPGKIAEEAMLAATRGVNTHRGAIFSLGLLSAAYGRLFCSEEFPVPEAVLDLCACMAADLPGELSAVARGPSAPTHGETLFAKYGLTGIRGEAAAGFPAVRGVGLPVLRRYLEEGASRNDAGVAALLALLTQAQDSNIAHRAGADALARIRLETGAFLAQNPSLPQILAKAADLDRAFIAAHISPGGAADLLAACFFLAFLGTG
jgi:holo-ACP synthase/triphosphoribosyl-dephospho-CoA synthase